MEEGLVVVVDQDALEPVLLLHLDDAVEVVFCGLDLVEGQVVGDHPGWGGWYFLLMCR